ncbi:MAG TPA: DUF1109 domain-containing protein [Oxalicibacterium sp.]|jgi:hypothetical protein|nr:DUF1109 domain-containing protein [Oxalicibacterium sp.]
MNTDELINMLASGDPRPPAIPVRRMLVLVTCGVLASVVLMATFLGVRADLIQVLAMPAFWLKVLFVLALAFIGWRLTARLSHPGLRSTALAALLALPLAVIWTMAAWSLMAAAPGERSELFWGSTWRVCPFLIAGLSLPILIAVLRAMRELAPTRLRLAGAAAGLSAGAAAATVYCLHCPEMAPPFVAFWYVIGILLATGTGALLGPRLLRW